MQINQLYSYILAIFSLINLTFAFICVKRLSLKNKKAKYYLLLSFAISTYAFGYSQEILQNTLNRIEFWLKIEYLGGSFIPSLWLIVVLELSGHSKLLMKNYEKYLLLFSLFILVIFFTNDEHKLYYTGKELINYTNFTLIKTDKGILYVLFVIYEVICNIYAILISANELLKENGRFKKQFSLVLIGSLFISFAFIINLNSSVFYKFDYLPLASLLFQFLIGLSMVRDGLINYVPIAYEFIIENMKEGFLVVNNEGIIVKFNDSFRKIANAKTSDFGKSVKSLEIYEMGLKTFFTNENLYKEKKETVTSRIGNKYYKINYTIAEEELFVWAFLFYEITEEQEYLKKIEYYATFDPLTNLLNRRVFYERGNKALEESEETSVITFDFDHFKLINDTFSHDAGDMVLEHFSKLINQISKENGFIPGRLGGEEFALVLPKCNLKLAASIAEDIRETMEREHLVYEEFILTITGSFGIAQRREGEDLKNLLKRADRALYIAKENGRNRIEIYN